MTKGELLERLRSWHGDVDEERAHLDSDKALLEFINDPEITDAFDEIDKWYA